MQRLHGQDAIFLYRETSTSIMHTLKVQIIKRTGDEHDFGTLYTRLKQHLENKWLLRRRVVPVPFGLHHPVLVEDPNFDLDAHIFRAAIPAPGTMRELDEMVAQLGSTLLDRSRPLWDMWILEGLATGDIAIVHRVHHSMSDGKAYMGFLEHGWTELEKSEGATTGTPPPLPRGTRLVWDAIVDHVKHDMWNLWPMLKSFIGNLRELSRRREASDEEHINPLTAEFPRTRFNYALGVRRSFSTCQLSLKELKSLKNTLGVTLNDVVLAIMAGALRRYFIEHDELPDKPLATSVPVGADAPNVTREMGNRVTSLFTMLHTEIEDPLKRLYAIKKATEQGKADLDIFGKHQWGDLMQYIPPPFMTWFCQRNFRLKPANRPDYKPNSNIAISNVPGPREKMTLEQGELEAIYSAGVLGEGMGLNITVWSYMDQLNVGALACRKAMPDLWRLTDAIPEAFSELKIAAAKAASG
ncbi:MAG: wax ester/triacylglycerol synthase family O-acyltransferase [Halioglobus sp.]